ncbi:nucleotide sugar dehydrogenase [Robertmurraya massiliosenegalensis]|uniref:nucleotide sugar dehydrogenase n=1 Tax=Robertmurraya TaxID=2837507 RepID=UPI0039A44AA2
MVHTIHLFLSYGKRKGNYKKRGCAMERRTEDKNVAVIGLGKIGLALAAVIADNGFHVIGADINPSVVSLVNQGKSHVKNEPGLEELVERAHKNNRLSATYKTVEAVKQTDVVIVIVPVLIDKKNETDYRYMDLAVNEIGKVIQKGTMVIFETTVPVGDTRNRFGKKIEEISGLVAGEDFHLVYSPERVYSNRIVEDLANYPKVIGAINDESLQRAISFYKEAIKCETMPVSSLETAEFSKVAECVYRDVNIALVNELAKFASEKGVAMDEVIQASNSQPFSHLHKPGIGVGGHCIPIYPFFFINKGLPNGITTLARDINDSMSEYAIDKLERELGSLRGKNILILGLSFRENVKEVTKSTTLLLLEQLSQREASIFVNDPQFSKEEIAKYGVTPLTFSDQMIEKIDGVIMQAYHEPYESLDFSIFPKCKVILDGRNVLNKDEITSVGIKYLGIGIE